MDSAEDILEFVLEGERYALDIQLVREVVGMIPITTIPRAPLYIAGVINYRGEITNIISLAALLGLPLHEIRSSQKIILLVPKATACSNVGIIADDVLGVVQVTRADVEYLSEGLASEVAGFVKGIIKKKGDASGKQNSGLVIWIDLKKIIEDASKK
jgi:purine-binding chemotaxis protein CheW